MKSKTIAFLSVLLLLVFTGCNNTPPNEEKPQPYSFSESNQNSAESETPVADESKEVETTPEPVQSLTPSENQKEWTEKDSVSTEQSQTNPDSEQITQIADLPKETDKTENNSSVPAKPSVPEQVESKEPEQEVIPPLATEPPDKETPSEPKFDIAYWVSFAKNYAKSVGLELNSEAIYCWDNPLGAGSHSKYLERDITACLNRYAKDEDITEVWVWAETIGNNTFELYIGYA